MLKARRAMLFASLLTASAITMPVLYAVRAFAAGVTAYHFPAPPIASAGSLGPSQTVTFNVTVVSGTTPDPGGVVYLFVQRINAKGDLTSVPASQCGGATQISGSASSPTMCAADSKGHVPLTYHAAPQPPAVGGAEFIAENAPSHATITANTHYAYTTVYRFASSPIAASGTLTPGAAVGVTLTAEGGLDQGIASSPLYLSFTHTTGGGSASVGSAALTSTPALFTTGSNGALQLTYMAPSTLPAGSQDTILVQDNASKPTEVNSDSYAFSAATPTISVGNVTVTEGDQHPRIPADFTVTISPVQTTPVTVQYTTLCGVGDQGCEGVIPDDFNSVVTPKTVTIRANTSSTIINVPQFSYIGGKGGESYNEGWFVKLINPESGAVMGRTVGEGLLQPDAESPPVDAYLYGGGAGVVPTTDSAGEPLYFTVTLGAVEKSAVTFSYATASGSALAGIDFTSVSGTATIAPSTTSTIITVMVLPNLPPSTAKTFTLTISNASGGLTISRATGTGTILSK